MASERRLHPLSIVVGVGGQIRGLLVPAMLLFLGVRPAAWGWEMFAPLLLLPSLLVAVLRYASFRYRLEPSEVVVREGIVFRQTRHIPFARVQSLDAHQGPFLRPFGVVSARLETGAGEQQTEAAFPALSAAAYDELRHWVRGDSRALDASDGGESDERPLLALGTRDLVLLGLIGSRGMVLVAAMVGLAWELRIGERIASRMMGSAATGESIGRQLVGWFEQAFGAPLLSTAAVGALIVTLLVISRILSTSWTVVQLHGYRLSRDGNDLRSEWGSLTRKTATIPVRRVQSLTVHEGPLERLTGRASVRVDTAGGRGEGDDAEREWLAPIVRHGDVAALVAEVVPGLRLAEVSWRPVHQGATRRRWKRGLILAGLVGVLMIAVVGPWGIIAAVGLGGLSYIEARESVRRLGWALHNGTIMVRRGWIWRTVTVAPFAKVQAVTLTESPFDRRARMASVAFDTAGASALKGSVGIPYLAESTARELASTLAERAARTDFSWA